MKLLNKKKILITGAGGVLGISHAKTFLHHGAELILSEINGSRLKHIKKEYQKNPSVKIFELDVTSEKSIQKVFDKILDKSNIDIIINNAAITGELLMNKNSKFPNLADTSLKMWDKTMKVNLTGSFLIAREIDRRKNINCKKLINISSMYAMNAPHHEIYKGMQFNSMIAYSSSKAGVYGLTKWLASYWKNKGITVNALAPGAVNNKHSSEFKKRVNDLIILNRMAEPHEISSALLYLCSDLSNYTNGQVLNVDGGFSAW